MKVYKICPICKKVYSADSKRLAQGRQTTCSRSCSYKYRMLNRRESGTREICCDWCGETFRRPLSNMAKHNFCSKECSNAWQRSGVAPKGEQHHQYTQVQARCDYCGKMFSRRPHKIKAAKHHYCSRECSLLASSKRMNIELKGSHVPCETCGKPVYRTPCHLKRESKTFCSFDCRSLWYSENFSGPNSPQYKHGLSSSMRYGREWPAISRRIQARDGNKCVVCGSKERLVAHHVIPVYEWRSPEEAHEEWNLITLCGSCHGRISHSECFPTDPEWDVARELGARLLEEAHV